MTTRMGAPFVTHSPIRRGDRRSRLIWLVALIGMVAIGLLAWVYVSTTGTVVLLDIVAGSALLVGLGAFVVSGAIVATHRPGDIIGPLLMVQVLVLADLRIGDSVVGVVDPTPTKVGPLLWLVLWAIGWSWAFLIFPIFHVMLTFPDGRLLSPKMAMGWPPCWRS